MKIEKIVLAVLAAGAMVIGCTSCGLFTKATVTLVNDVVKKTDNSSTSIYNIELMDVSGSTAVTVQTHAGRIETGSSVSFRGVEKDAYYCLGGYITSSGFGPYIWLTNDFFLDENMKIELYKNLYGMYDPTAASIKPSLSLMVTNKNGEQKLIPVEIKKVEE